MVVGSSGGVGGGGISNAICCRWWITCMHTPTHAHIHTRTKMHPHPHTHTHIHVHTPIHIYLYMCIYTHTHAHINKHNNETHATAPVCTLVAADCRTLLAANGTDFAGAALHFRQGRLEETWHCASGEQAEMVICI